MVYILFQLGLLSGFLAAHYLDAARWHLLGRRRLALLRVGPLASTLLAAVAPGVGQLLMGRAFTGSYVLLASFTVIALVPVPFELLGVPWALIFGPLWLANILEAWWLGRHLGQN